MPFKLLTISFALFLFACQNTSSDKKEKPKASTQEAVQEEIQEKKAVPSETARLITGSDSILISKKKVVEDYDRQWSVISYTFYDENLALSKWQKAINRFIRKSLYRQEEAKQYNEPLSKELIRKVLLVFKKEARHYEDDMPWNISENYQIDDAFKTFAVLKIESSLYTGGAHGSYGVGYYYFDKSSAKELHIKDFIDTKKELLRAAELVFRKKVGIKANTPFEETDYWFSDGFYLSDNFEITDQGITFIYNPYEISNYANGMIEFTLTKTQIEPFLKRKIDWK
ncbi:MAG: RsiV family protein [Sphingomonadales bacterium]